LGGKQIELLKEALPTVSRVAFLWDSTVGLIPFRATEAVAQTAGVGPLSLPRCGLAGMIQKVTKTG